MITLFGWLRLEAASITVDTSGVAFTGAKVSLPGDSVLGSTTFDLEADLAIAFGGSETTGSAPAVTGAVRDRHPVRHLALVGWQVGQELAFCSRMASRRSPTRARPSRIPQQRRRASAGRWRRLLLALRR